MAAIGKNAFVSSNGYFQTEIQMFPKRWVDFFFLILNRCHQLSSLRIKEIGNFIMCLLGFEESNLDKLFCSLSKIPLMWRSLIPLVSWQ